MAIVFFIPIFAPPRLSDHSLQEMKVMLNAFEVLCETSFKEDGKSCGKHTISSKKKARAECVTAIREFIMTYQGKGIESKRGSSSNHSVFKCKWKNSSGKHLCPLHIGMVYDSNVKEWKVTKSSKTSLAHATNCACVVEGSSLLLCKDLVFRDCVESMLI